MKALGQGSLASVLKVGLDIVWYGLWAFMAMIGLILLATITAFIMDVIGHTPSVLSELFDFLMVRGRMVPLTIPLMIAALVLIDRLRRIFATLVAGDPFVPENAGHLRVIAITIAVFQLLRHAIQGILAMVLTVADQPIEGGYALEFNAWNVDLGAWFAVGVLLIFAEVFREGARMRQEQQLTI